MMDPWFSRHQTLSFGHRHKFNRRNKQPHEISDTCSPEDMKKNHLKVNLSRSISNSNTNSPISTVNTSAVITLTKVNETLHKEIADLKRSLVSRDVEIIKLRARIQCLTDTVEQQDQILAEKYNSNHQISSSNQLEDTQYIISKKEGHGSIASKRIPSSKNLYKMNTSERHFIEKSQSFTPNFLSTSQRTSSDAATEYSSFRSTCSDTITVLSNQDEEDGSLGDSKTSIRGQPLFQSLERRDSNNSESDFIKSAGFLRQSKSRKASGRLSVSSFGLLDEEETMEDDKSSETSSNVVHTSLQRSKTQVKKENQMEKDEEMTYSQFLERISMPASRDILDAIRKFLGSILGPRFNGHSPRASDYMDYEYVGTVNLQCRCKEFFEDMETMLQRHVAWRHASEATLLKARDGIEKYIMDKIIHLAMEQLQLSYDWKKEDEHLLHRMKVLSFVTPDMLDINPCMRNEVVWSMADDELRRINAYRSPGDKINCVVRCCNIIFSVLNLSRGENGSRPGADDFLPVFIYIVLHSKIPHLPSTCQYISAYRNPTDLMSKAGYCFVNLQSAIEFIKVMDGSMLSISKEKFHQLYQEQEQMLQQLE